ncbi:MAG: Alcohol dehydrogenase zinc-binding domain protein [Actinomycetia bacterium]|nr:Alcohol dehydrogenase zinc-binding domain protein [Actinomycetes bacterium]
MRAALLLAVDEPLVIESLTPEPLGPHDVRVQVDASGVCHSDLSIATGLVPMPPPVILGHEGAGTVLEVGDRVTRVRVGDRVISSFVPACGECWYCVHDQSNFCERMLDVAMARHSRRSVGTKVFSMSGLGTFSDEMISHEWSLVAVETDLPAEQLALIGCGVMTGVGSVLNTARVQPGSTVAVIGLGGVGQAVVQGARVAGAARVIAIDPVAMKRTTAAGLGASDLVDPADGDIVEQVQALTGGRGADYAFEVVGRPETMIQARDLTRRGGTVVIVGMPAFDATVTFPAYSMFYDEKSLLGSNYGSAHVRRDFPKIVSLIEGGSLDVAHMVTKTIALEDVNAAFAAMTAGDVIRSVIVPNT